jgi:hypothetical protein
MRSVTRCCMIAVALISGAAVVPACADPLNGQKLFFGEPSARFPTGSQPCSACHDLSPADPARNAAGNPGIIVSAIYSSLPSTGAMKPLYGVGGESPLASADEQDLADYLESVVSGGPPGAAFTATPAAAAFASQVVGTPSAPVPFTIANSGAAGTLSSIASSDSTEFVITGGSCLPMPVALAQGGSCTVAVVFAPTSTGARSGTLTITDDGAPNPLQISLSGTGAPAGPSGPGTKVTVVEYYDATLDHYFITPLASEIALCDAGTPPCAGWVRTGMSFNGFDSSGAPASSVAVCRFFNATFAPKSSHFYALHGLGCEETIADFPDWTLESSDLFGMYLPDDAGNCPGGSNPVYRLYNNGMGGAPNHRFVTGLADRAAMIAKGYVPEGFGPLGVGMCSPL